MNTRLPSSGCERVRGRLEVYVDGGLASDEEARDRGHLEACDACRRSFQEWLAFLDDVRSAAPAHVDEPRLERFEGRLAARLEEPGEAHGRRPARTRSGLTLVRRALVPLGAMAAGLLVLLGLELGGLGLGALAPDSEWVALPDLDVGWPTWDHVVGDLGVLEDGAGESR